MKTINLPITGQSCYKCHMDIMAITTPSGGDYITCPLCFYGTEGVYDNDGIDYVNDDDEEDRVLYCKKCHILFRIGCTHGENGCTDNVFYPEFIYKFTMDGNEKIGMPYFDSVDEIVKNYKKMNCQWLCMCHGTCAEKQCLSASYPNWKSIKCHCKVNLGGSLSA